MRDYLHYDPRHAALLVVDLQPDFLPGGALPIQEGDAILEPIRRIMEREPFAVCVATQDWHPPGHVSFASTHAGRRHYEKIQLYGREQILWPDHCVQGTPGAELHRDLPWERVSAIIRKATVPDVDSYSAFRNNWDAEGKRPPTGLAGYLRDRGIRDVVILRPRARFLRQVERGGRPGRGVPHGGPVGPDPACGPGIGRPRARRPRSGGCRDRGVGAARRGHRPR